MRFDSGAAKGYAILLIADSDSSVGSPFTKAFHQEAVKNHLGSNAGVETSLMELMLDRISTSNFGATAWYFPAMGVWDKVRSINPA